jgi:thymidylate synthase
MKQYLDLCKRIINEGEWVYNKRTGKRCLTVINADFEYDCSRGQLPVLTTKKTAWKPAIAEMLGYLRGYTSAAQFRALGCNSWNANANENAAWLANPFRKGEDDMGRCYGAQGRDWKNPEGESIDQLRNVYDDT